MAAELLVRPGRVDLPARPADVRLERQLGVGAEGAEVGDQARRRKWRLDHLVGPRQRVVRREVVEDEDAVRGGDRGNGNRHRLGSRRIRRHRRVEHTGRVVVQDDADRARVLRVEGLVVEAAGAAANEHDLPRQRAGGGSDTSVVRRRRCPGRGELAAARGRDGGEGASRAVVRVEVAADLERRQRRLRVVERCDADHLAAHPGRAGRPQLAAVRAAVPDRRNDDDACVDEIVGGDGFRGLGPVAERRADAHVEDIRMVLERQLHRVDHHVRIGGPVAPEDAIGEQARTGCDAHDLAGMSTAVCGRDAGDVRAVTCVGRPGAEHLGAVGVVGITRKRIRVRLGHRLEGWALRVVVRVADEIEAAADLAARPKTAAELGQRVVEPAVHDRDRDAGAVETELGLGLIGAGEADGVLHVDSGATRLGAPVRQRDGVDGVDRLDARNRLERRNL